MVISDRNGKRIYLCLLAEMIRSRWLLVKPCTEEALKEIGEGRHDGVIKGTAKHIYAKLPKSLRCSDTLEDLRAEVTLWACEAAHQFDGRNSSQFVTFLWKSSKRKAIDYLRRSRLQKRQSLCTATRPAPRAQMDDEYDDSVGELESIPETLGVADVLGKLSHASQDTFARLTMFCHDERNGRGRREDGDHTDGARIRKLSCLARDKAHFSCGDCSADELEALFKELLDMPEAQEV